MSVKSTLSVWVSLNDMADRMHYKRRNLLYRVAPWILQTGKKFRVSKSGDIRITLEAFIRFTREIGFNGYMVEAMAAIRAVKEENGIIKHG